MANAIILHRRRSKKIEPGSQTFSSSGTFVAPYSAVYTISMIGSKQKAGNGGTGAAGYYYRPSGSIYADASPGGSGGAGEYLPTISMPPGWATSQSAVAGRTGASGQNGDSTGSSMYGDLGGDAEVTAEICEIKPVILAARVAVVPPPSLAASQ